MKTVAISTIVLFVYIFFYEWILHGVLLDASYLATAELWRSEEAMLEKMGFMVGGQFLIAVFLVQIFQRMPSGWIFVGLCLGALYSAGQLVMYAVAPYPLDLTVKWIVGALVEYGLAGVIYGVLAARLARPSS